jgi:hypothetical protein
LHAVLSLLRQHLGTLGLTLADVREPPSPYAEADREEANDPDTCSFFAMTPAAGR